MSRPYSARRSNADRAITPHTLLAGSCTITSKSRSTGKKDERPQSKLPRESHCLRRLWVDIGEVQPQWRGKMYATVVGRDGTIGSSTCGTLGQVTSFCSPDGTAKQKSRLARQLRSRRPSPAQTQSPAKKRRTCSPRRRYGAQVGAGDRARRRPCKLRWRSSDLHRKAACGQGKGKVERMVCSWRVLLASGSC